MPDNPSTSIFSVHTRRSVQKGALHLLLVTVGVSALLGALALLLGDFGETHAKILGTTATISAASILAMASATGIGRRETAALPVAGIALAIGAGLLLVTGIWTESEGEAFWKTTATVGVLAIGVSNGSLMTSIRLKNNVRWVQFVALGSSAILAFTIVSMIWSENGEEGTARFVGIIGIVMTGSSIAVPILGRLSRLHESDSEDSAFRFCPRCGRQAKQPTLAGGLISCTGCRAEVRVTLAQSMTSDGDASSGLATRPRPIL